MRRDGQVAGAQGVHPVGEVGLALAAVHVGEGGAVDDDLRAKRGDGGGGGGEIGDVVLGQIEQEGGVSGAVGPAQDLLKRQTELALLP